MKKFLFILMGVFAFSGAFAAGENVPTSKSYVDAAVAQKQDKISASTIMPAGYTTLEYIEGTGPQYINTGVQTSSTQRIEYDVRLDHVVMSNGETQILGAGGAIVGTLYSFRFEPGANIKILYKASEGGVIDTNIPQDTNRHRLVLDLKNKFASVDGTTFNFSSLPSGQTYSQYLFAYSRLGTANTQYGFKGKMYGAKIYDNGVLVRNFIPARRDSDGVLGMYDTVSDTFFINSGTGEFIAGPVIIPGNQVLTNTGTAGEVGAMGIYDANGEYATQQNNLVDAVTMNTAVQNAIDSEFQCVEYNPNDPTDCWLLDIVHAQDAMAVPIGYTTLEYIEGTGSQYIDTGVQTSSTQRIEYDVRLDHVVTSNGESQILGAGGANEGTLYSFRFEPGANIKILYKADGGIDTNIPQDTNRHRLILDLKNKFASVDGTTFNFSSLPSGQTYSQYLFAYSRLGTVDTRYGFKGKMYGAKIYDNGVLVRNFIPVRRNSDGVLGMYDKVTNTFFTNSGTDEFIAGLVVYLPQGN